jgi:hypothetical protein
MRSFPMCRTPRASNSRFSFVATISIVRKNSRAPDPKTSSVRFGDDHNNLAQILGTPMFPQILLSGLNPFATNAFSI